VQQRGHQHVAGSIVEGEIDQDVEQSSRCRYNAGDVTDSCNNTATNDAPADGADQEIEQFSVCRHNRGTVTNSCQDEPGDSDSLSMAAQRQPGRRET
jgi:hypothetical protein